MNNELISAILLGIIPLAAGSVIIYWHICTKGSWRDWPAGRSLMGLLGIITVGFAYGLVNRFLGNYPAKFVVAVGLYVLFIGAIIFIGMTIRKEMRLGKSRLVERTNEKSGPVTVTVATHNEEAPHE